MPASANTVYGVVQNRVALKPGLTLPEQMIAPLCFQRWCAYGSMWWRSREATRERAQVLGHPRADRSERVSDLATRHSVSRKFVYRQTHKAAAALDGFSPAAPNSEVLFEPTVTKAWLRQVIVALVLICRSSYRGMVKFLRDLLGMAVSVGCIQDVLQSRRFLTLPFDVQCHCPGRPGVAGAIRIHHSVCQAHHLAQAGRVLPARDSWLRAQVTAAVGQVSAGELEAGVGAKKPGSVRR